MCVLLLLRTEGFFFNVVCVFNYFLIVDYLLLFLDLAAQFCAEDTLELAEDLLVGDGTPGLVLVDDLGLLVDLLRELLLRPALGLAGLLDAQRDVAVERLDLRRVLAHVGLLDLLRVLGPRTLPVAAAAVLLGHLKVLAVLERLLCRVRALCRRPGAGTPTPTDDDVVPILIAAHFVV